MPSRHCLKETSKSCEYCLLIFGRDSQTFRVNRGNENTFSCLYYFNIKRWIVPLSKVPTTEHLQALADPLSERLHLLPCKVLLCVCVFSSSFSVMSLCDPMGQSPPGPSAHEISQTRILEWGAISSSSGAFQPRDQSHASSDSCIRGWILYHYGHLGWDYFVWVWVKAAQSCLTLCDAMDYIACQASLSMEFSRQDTEVDSCSLLQGIFPTQGLNSDLLDWGQILYHLSHQGNPLYFVVISKTQKL